jgi:hypothetical protein
MLLGCPYLAGAWGYHASTQFLERASWHSGFDTPSYQQALPSDANRSQLT